MATTSDILAEFLISIGWSFDEPSRKKLVAAEQKTTKELEKEQKQRDVFDKKRRESALAAAKELKNFATVATVTAASVVGALGAMGEAFERAFYSSSRTGSSVKELNAFKFAASQMGSSAEEAQSAVEGLARKVRETGSGYATWLKQLGASNPNDIVKSLNEIAPKLAAMPLVQAEAISKQFNIPENLLLAMRQVGEFQKFEEQANRKYGILGFDPQQAAEDGRALTRSFRDLFDTFAKIGEKTGSGLFKDLQPQIERLNNFLLANGDKISAMLIKIADALFKAFAWVTEHLTDLDKFVERMGGWNIALTALAGIVSVAFVGRMAGLLKSMAGLAGIVPPGWLLALLGIGATPMIEHALRSPVDRAFDALTGSPATPQEDTNRNMGVIERGKKIYQGVKSWFGGGGSNAPIASGNFNAKAPGVATRLKADFGLTDEEAAAVLGNLGHESTGLTAFEEDHGRGPGRGWAQWTTRERRDGFFRYAQEHGLDPRSDEANYGYLRQELRTNYAGAITALKDAQGLQNKTVAFERAYEGAGIKSYGSRMAYARAALNAMRQQPAKTPPMLATNKPIVPFIKPLPGTVNSPFGDFNADRLRSYFNPPPLGVSSNDNTKNVTIQQTNHNTISGVSDPTAAAAAVGSRQDKHSSLLLRNVQSAIA